MIQWAKLIVDLVKALAWPAAIFGIAYLFSDDIRKLLPRLSKAGPTGVEFEAYKQEVAQSFTGQLRELPGIARTPTIAGLEKLIHEQLMMINPASHIDLLVRRLAEAQLQAKFERVYAVMFGSQVAGLRALATASGTVSRNDAVRFFDEQATSRPDLKQLNLTFEAWLRYLVASGLVAETSDSVGLTEEGKDFLLFLSASHPNDAKAA